MRSYSKLFQLTKYESVLNGKLYEEFISKYSDNISRKEVKNTMFKVLFSRNVIFKNFKRIIPYQKEKQVFSSVYPFVYEVIKLLKFKDHSKLSIYLQKIESFIFIDCIAKELVENGIIPFTIHDYIIVEAEHKLKSIEIMNDVFMKQTGIKPSFEVKNI